MSESSKIARIEQYVQARFESGLPFSKLWTERLGFFLWGLHSLQSRQLCKHYKNHFKSVGLAVITATLTDGGNDSE